MGLSVAAIRKKELAEAGTNRCARGRICFEHFWTLGAKLFYALALGPPAD